MKKISLIILVLSVFILSGCQKKIKVDSIEKRKDFYSAKTEYDNLDGIEFDYSILPNEKILIINHYPRQTGIEKPKSDKLQKIENIEMKEVIEENGEIKSITIGNYKFIQK